MSQPRAFLTAEWRYLAMLNFEAPPALLRPLVPRGTELDTFGGATLVSMVGFRFLNTRVLGVAVPLHRDFDEVNLRFYVRRRDPTRAWRRAVVFVRELVPRRAIALVARWCYNEPYSAVPMRHELAMATAGEGAPGRARYAWQWAGQWHHLEVRTRGRPLVPPADSEAAFITEHYWGYTAQRDGGCKAYQVSHPQWRVWDAEGSSFDCDAAALYGPGFAECLAAPPRSAFVAEGSAVTVYAGTRIPVTVDSTRATAHHAS